MHSDRFQFIITHPVLGRVARVGLSSPGLRWVACIALACCITAVGLTAHYFILRSSHSRLVRENSALSHQLDELAEAAAVRSDQLAAVSSVASQISIAYGLKRAEASAASPDEDNAGLAYFASLEQFEDLQGALSGQQGTSERGSLLANTTPAIWPVKGRITSSYGKRQDPFNGTGVFHPGIDFSAPYRTPVRSSADGSVVSAKWEGNLGHTVRIRHGKSGYRTVYGHLKEHFVRVGQSVRRGEVIGLVGRSGRTTGSHLHYEVHISGTNVNPYRYLRDRERTYEDSLAD